jgi:hypothetical protein
VKVGDLVKYKKSMSGLEKCLGIIVARNGKAFDIRWLDRHTRKRGIGALVGRETSVEIPDFLEVVSESR